MNWNIILELENMIVDDKYNNEFFQKILEKIKDIFVADGCIWYRTMRKDDIIRTKDSFFVENDYFLLGNANTSGTLMIVKPDRNILNDSKLLNFLEIYLANINKLSKMILEYEDKIYCDSLTGVYNNEALINRINSSNKFNNVGVLFVDANGLGIVNNMFGHDAGDTMLKTLADCISTFFRKGDIYRKGGDEFVVICSDISEDLFLKKVELLKYKLSLTEYSASFGYAYSDGTKDINSLIKIADKNMYLEKEEYRKNNVSKYNVKIKK